MKSLAFIAIARSNHTMATQIDREDPRTAMWRVRVRLYDLRELILESLYKTVLRVEWVR